MESRLMSSTSKSVSNSQVFDWAIENFDRICPHGCHGFPRFDSPRYRMQHPSGKATFWDLLVNGASGKIQVCWIRRCLGPNPHYLQITGTTGAQWIFSIWLGNDELPTLHKANEVRKTFALEDLSSDWIDLISVAALYDRRHELLVHGKLRIRVMMTVTEWITSTLESAVVLPVPQRNVRLLALPGPPQVAESGMLFESLLEMDTEFSDVTFYCGQEEIKAHKCILANRSRVFRRMFRSHMNEAVSGVVHVYDLGPFTLRCILRYIYTGKVSVADPDDLLSVINGAEKYGLDDLKHCCFAKLVNCITDEIAGRLAVAAFIYRAQPEVVQAIRDYLNQDFVNKVQANPELRQLVNQYPNAFF